VVLTADSELLKFINTSNPDLLKVTEGLKSQEALAKRDEKNE
jgi:hypothetical protein